ncbi:hypothetical protein Nepgr_033258 [Nepenthes gracilis]|uniref:Uncharacterized protein n=1 Tax=Nepenthes gracilis TaxID=150966 RepID=A0AAD3TK63_NEPGR|nr:hypothetical protein Nepgr_033258 [Nepenthes gracilis]
MLGHLSNKTGFQIRGECCAADGNSEWQSERVIQRHKNKFSRCAGAEKGFSVDLLEKLTLLEDGWVVCRVFRKNLFKVGSEGGSGTTIAHNTASNLLPGCNIDGSGSSHQSPLLMQRDSCCHPYLERHHHASEHSQHTSMFDLYMKQPADLGLHTYSNSQMPDSHPQHDHYSHHHHQKQNLIPNNSERFNNTKAVGIYDDFSAQQLTTDQSPLMLKQLISRNCVSAEAARGGKDLGYGRTTNGLQVTSPPQQIVVAAAAATAAAGNEWAMPMLDTTSSVHRMDLQRQQQQLALREEMNFWGYSK